MKARSKHVRTTALAGMVAACVLIALVAYRNSSPVGSSVAPRSTTLGVELIGSSKDKDSKNTFQISGNVDGLYPGAQKQLTVTVTNPNNFAIKVTSLTVTVRSPGVTGCVANSVVATNFSGSLIVPKNGSATKGLPIRMIANAANACQGATFPLTFGGSAEKA